MSIAKPCGAAGRLTALIVESVVAVGVATGVAAWEVGTGVMIGGTTGGTTGVTIEMGLVTETAAKVEELACVPTEVAPAVVIGAVVAVAASGGGIFAVSPASSSLNFSGVEEEDMREQEEQEEQEQEEAVANKKFREGELFARRPRYDVCLGDSNSFLVAVVVMVIGAVLGLAEVGEGGARAALRKWIAIGSSPKHVCLLVFA